MEGAAGYLINLVDCLRGIGKGGRQLVVEAPAVDFYDAGRTLLGI
jgi:hypothetical protein